MPIDDEAVRRLRALAQDDARPEPSRDGSRSRGGEVVGDRFEIDDAIGEGGMGVVYRALDRDTRAVVALKLVRIENAAEEERFAREVAAVAGLQHPGIVRYVAHALRATESASSRRSSCTASRWQSASREVRSTSVTRSPSLGAPPTRSQRRIARGSFIAT